MSPQLQALLKNYREINTLQEEQQAMVDTAVVLCETAKGKPVKMISILISCQMELIKEIIKLEDELAKSKQVIFN